MTTPNPTDAGSQPASGLVDRFGRRHTDLRVSVTDRCNLRCTYCMPCSGVAFRPHEEILTYEEIARFVTVAAELGIRCVRLTGGEPLVRRGVVDLVKMLGCIPGIDEVTMTTNAVLLTPFAGPLFAAGLRRINVSLDTVDRECYRRLTQRDELPSALAGIEAARRAGFQRIKLNALAIRGFTEDQVLPLARFARSEGLELRFIEYMPTVANCGGSDYSEEVGLCGDSRGVPGTPADEPNKPPAEAREPGLAPASEGHSQPIGPVPVGSTAENWSPRQVLAGDEILRILAAEYGPATAIAADRAGAPATEYRFDDGGRVGIIRSVTAPFCGACTRLRLTADGRLRNCLFDQATLDVRGILRRDQDDAPLREILLRSVGHKQPFRGSCHGGLVATDRPMHQIGG
jgi:cyclic pyranopterin phosphate synthase